MAQDKKIEDEQKWSKEDSEALQKLSSDMSAKDFYENLFNLDFLTEEERETIYTATELYAKGKVRIALLNKTD